MGKLKYIVGEFPCDSGVCDGAVVFPSAMFHADTARNLRARKIYGAGFFNIDDGVVTVYGRSDSLNVDSRPEDARAIARILGLVS